MLEVFDSKKIPIIKVSLETPEKKINITLSNLQLVNPLKECKNSCLTITTEHDGKEEYIAVKEINENSFVYDLVSFAMNIGANIPNLSEVSEEKETAFLETMEKMNYTVSNNAYELIKGLSDRILFAVLLISQLLIIIN